MPTSKGHWEGHIRGHEKHTWAQGRPAAGAERVPVFSYFGNRFKFRPLGNMGFGEKLSMSWKTEKLKSKLEVRPQEKGNFPLLIEKSLCGCGSECESGTSFLAPTLTRRGSGACKGLTERTAAKQELGPPVLGSWGFRGRAQLAQCLQTSGAPALRLLEWIVVNYWHQSSGAGKLERKLRITSPGPRAPALHTDSLSTATGRWETRSWLSGLAFICLFVHSYPISSSVKKGKGTPSLSTWNVYSGER